jgi:hypothetical protein
MKKLNSLNLDKSLSRSEMRNINGGRMFGRSCKEQAGTTDMMCCSHTFWVRHNCVAI